MAIRTNDGKVKGILLRDYDLKRKPSLEPFIATANVIVDRVAICAVGKSITLSVAELELIERWLAAHFYKYAWDRQFASKSTGGASGSYGGQTAMHLNGTTYGQNALMVDYSGCLTNLSETQQADGFWLGKAPSDQTDYSDRD